MNTIPPFEEKVLERKADRGSIPHLNRAVQPDVSYDNFCRCRERKPKLIGKESTRT